MLYAMPTRGSGLARDGQTVVKVPADAKIEDPVPGLDLVFNVESQFLDIGMAKVVIEASRCG